MEGENQAQLAEIEPGKTFIVYDVTAIEASAPAPLAEVKDQVAAELLLERAASDARKAAEQVLAAGRKGTDLAEAMAALGKPLPPVDRLTMTRVDLTRMQGQVPPPLALMFSMAEGTVKLLPAPRNRGWFVVALKDIIPGAVPANDPVVPAVQRELGGAVGREYAEQLRRAIRADVGVERNEAAIKAVLGQLSGNN
jgi:peptidyl-prolyl cis-trans isomerase D